MLQHLTDYDASKTWREDKHALVECSTFADDYKYRGEGWQRYYHYINYPYIEDDDEEVDLYKIRSSSKNITEACKQIVAWLSGKQGEDYKESYIYTYLTTRKYPDEEDDNVAKSYAFRMLVHFLGDIVQPLHSMSRFSPELPKGDKGGNAFKLPYRYRVKSLHSLWDKVLYEERYNIRRPISDDKWADFQEDVDKAMNDHLDTIIAREGFGEENPYEYQVSDFDDWTVEAFELAKSLYEGITANEKVPQEYLDKNIPIAYE